MVPGWRQVFMALIHFLYHPAIIMTVNIEVIYPWIYYLLGLLQIQSSRYQGRLVGLQKTMEQLATLFQEHKDGTSSKLENFCEQISELRNQQNSLAQQVKASADMYGTSVRMKRKRVLRKLSVSVQNFLANSYIVNSLTELHNGAPPHKKFVSTERQVY